MFIALQNKSFIGSHKDLCKLLLAIQSHDPSKITIRNLETNAVVDKSVYTQEGVKTLPKIMVGLTYEDGNGDSITINHEESYSAYKYRSTQDSRYNGGYNSKGQHRSGEHRKALVRLIASPDRLFIVFNPEFNVLGVGNDLSTLLRNNVHNINNTTIILGIKPDGTTKKYDVKEFIGTSWIGG